VDHEFPLDGDGSRTRFSQRRREPAGSVSRVLSVFLTNAALGGRRAAIDCSSASLYRAWCLPRFRRVLSECSAARAPVRSSELA